MFVSSMAVAMCARWVPQRLSVSRQTERICRIRVSLVWAKPGSGGVLSCLAKPSAKPRSASRCCAIPVWSGHPPSEGTSVTSAPLPTPRPPVEERFALVGSPDGLRLKSRGGSLSPECFSQDSESRQRDAAPQTPLRMDGVCSVVRRSLHSGF